ncbi:MAG: GNAT family N-acetyltransferase [Thiolinea sp.]
MKVRITPISETESHSIHNPDDSLFLEPSFRHALAREFRLQAVDLQLEVQEHAITIPAYRKYSGQRQRIIIGAGFDKSGDVQLPAGMSFADCIAALTTALKQQHRKVTRLEIRSKHRLPGMHDHSDKTELVIQPGKPCSEWIMDFSKSTRRNIRLPFKHGFYYETGTGLQQLETFYRLYLQHMHELGSLSHSRTFFQELWENCRDNISLFIGYIGKTPVVASFQLLSTDEVYSAWVGMNAEYKKFNVLLGLIWSLTEYCQQSGRSRYNLGRSSVNSGAYHLKKRLANQERRIYYYDLNLHTGKSALPGKLHSPVYKGASGLIRNSPPLLMQSLSRHLMHRFY